MVHTCLFVTHSLPGVRGFFRGVGGTWGGCRISVKGVHSVGGGGGNFNRGISTSYVLSNTKEK